MRPMSDSAYRWAKVILSGTAVVGGLLVGWRWSQVGRYREITRHPSQINPVPILDTTTGKIHNAEWAR